MLVLATPNNVETMFRKARVAAPKQNSWVGLTKDITAALVVVMDNKGGRVVIGPVWLHGGVIVSEAPTFEPVGSNKDVVLEAECKFRCGVQMLRRSFSYADFHGKMPGCCTNSKGGVAAYKIFDDPEVCAQVLNLLNKGTQCSGPSHQ